MTTCTHHWQIEPARGPTSQGKCAHCGEVREFKNSSDEAVDGSWNYERKRRGRPKKQEAAID